MDDTTKCEWDPALHHGEECPHHKGGGGVSDTGTPKEEGFGDSIDDFLSSFDENDIESFLGTFSELGIDTNAIDYSQIISLKNFAKARENIISKDSRSASVLFSDEYMTKINDNVNKIIDRSHIGSWANTSIVLQILLDDEFKNQFQTGDSEGCLSPDYRAKCSNWLFGSEGVIEPTLERQQRRNQLEKYGCLVGGNLLNLESQYATHYGNCYFIFKDEVRNRTTMTLDDSLGYGYFNRLAFPCLLTEGLHQRQLDTRKNNLDSLLGAKTAIQLKNAAASGSSYLELQFHGKIQPSKDVDAIFIPFESLKPYYEEDKEEIIEILRNAKQKGISILTSKPSYGVKVLNRVEMAEDGSLVFSSDDVKKYDRHLR